MEDKESNRRFLSIIRKNAEGMHNLIDDILELSAIEAGMVRVEVEAVRLYALVNDVLSALASRAEARAITLKNEVASQAIVHADARRLEQMLTNLVHNAIKFNRENGSVTINHERRERDRISVVDTGDGIRPEHIKRIFERFYRVDRARSREMGGTGLGLAIVKHLARAHGGEVSVQSTPGEGSTFVIELPLSMSEKLEQQEPITLSAGQ
jgi:two-component system phosphate regulon sensor histidine kinase PhoR